MCTYLNERATREILDVIRRKGTKLQSQFTWDELIQGDAQLDLHGNGGWTVTLWDQTPNGLHPVTFYTEQNTLVEEGYNTNKRRG